MCGTSNLPNVPLDGTFGKADNLIQLERALARAEPKLRTAFIEMVLAARGALALDEIEILITTGRIDEALAIALAGASNLGSAQTRVFVNAAQDVANQIGRTLGQIIIDFDQTNTFAVNAMRQNQLNLISGFTFQQREATNLALLNGIRRGDNPRELALAFRNSIGLTARQVQAVENFRLALQAGNTSALQRALRDRRFDPTIQRAFDTGTPLTEKQINKMVERYHERMLMHRATVISRTEALRSVHEGAEAMFMQSIEQGQLSAENLERRWNTAKDERVRGSHRTMHGQLRPFGVPFISGAGNSLRFPGDSNAPGSETIQCRCTLGTRIISIFDLTGTTFHVLSAA